MPVVRLASETDAGGWRAAARDLRLRGVPPKEVLWTVDGAGGDLFGGVEEAAAPPSQTPPSQTPPTQASPPRAAPFSAPRTLLDLAQLVTLHRSDERFDLLYRLLWGLRERPDLLRMASDPDVARANQLAGEVRRAADKMKAFVRFRPVQDEAGDAYVAWFEPAHRVTELTAPFFVRRYANQRFSILTPDVCARWDLRTLSFAPGADPADAPGDDALEDAWKTYYASTFNPVRLRTAAMQREMPRRDGRNPPEAALIPDLIAQAPGRTDGRVRPASTEPARRIVRAAVRNSRDAPWDGAAPTSLAELAAGVDHCRRCPLWRDATQGVPGEGPPQARLLFVGEQPGDQEDLAGRPFVGPAGQVFDRALAEAGVPRAETYVTNAVKHFKHELRGKRRIHQTPSPGEVAACRGWLDAERRLVRPRVIVMLGATAALGVTGRPVPISTSRGQPLRLPDQAQGVVTYHPSFLLRVPDAEAEARAYAAFVEDLRLAWSLAA